MSIKKLISMFIALIVCSCALTLAADQAQPNQRRLLSTSAKATSPVSGKEMYTTYCALPWNDGKGAGPAASALKCLHGSFRAEQEQRRKYRD